jgi:spore coat polysaccharide biosynthesis predicted glycosyltransferase SpsG
MDKIVFLTEAGPGIGMGHINRCCALADGFEALGISPQFKVRGVQRMDNLHEKQVTYTEWFDLKILDEILSLYSTVIVDTYLANTETLRLITQNAGFPVFLVDSTLKYHPGGTILFPSVYANKYEHLKGGDRWISGKDYLLFGKELWHLPSFKVRNEVYNIAIILGGFVEHNFVQPIIESIKSIFPKSWINIFGSVDKSPLDDSNINYRGYLSKQEYIKALYQSDIAIAGAGLSLNECALIGLPVISVAINETQLMNSKTWKEVASVEFVRIGDKDLNSNIHNYLKNLKSKGYREHLHQILKATLDAKGGLRAANELLQLNSRHENN